MVGIDTHLRIIHRLSVFQWIILNSLTIDLQPLNGVVQAELGVTDKAQLATELSAQILKHSIAVSNRTVNNRRVNACAGLKKGFVKSFVDELLVVKKEDDMKLFGGKVDRMVKSKAKEAKNLDVLAKVSLASRSQEDLIVVLLPFHLPRGGGGSVQRKPQYARGAARSRSRPPSNRGSQWKRSVKDLTIPSYDPMPRAPRGRGGSRGASAFRGRGRRGRRTPQYL